jgi:hypothetical protein
LNNLENENGYENWMIFEMWFFFWKKDSFFYKLSDIKMNKKCTCTGLQFIQVWKMNRFNVERIWKLNDFENGNGFEQWTIFKMGTF